jgi:hypothetical protein
VRQPLGFRYFPRELASLPKGWLAGMGTVVLVGESEKGGHFGARVSFQFCSGEKTNSPDSIC